MMIVTVVIDYDISGNKLINKVHLVYVNYNFFLFQVKQTGLKVFRQVSISLILTKRCYKRMFFSTLCRLNTIHAMNFRENNTNFVDHFSSNTSEKCLLYLDYH